jgi:hypothetical protein
MSALAEAVSIATDFLPPEAKTALPLKGGQTNSALLAAILEFALRYLVERCAARDPLRAPRAMVQMAQQGDPIAVLAADDAAWAGVRSEYSWLSLLLSRRARADANMLHRHAVAAILGATAASSPEFVARVFAEIKGA